MRNLTPNQKIRDLQQRYQDERTDSLCVTMNGYCGHTHDPIPLPKGVRPIATLDFSGLKTTTRTILIRYTRREYGGWNVVRADNGRTLGWVVKHETGDYTGLWSAHADTSAFRGDGPDDTGNLLDEVPPHLHRSPDGNPFKSGIIEVNRTRDEATQALIFHLLREWAPAVGFDAHPGVVVRHGRSRDHFALGEHDDHCACGDVWPCPRRAALVEQGR